MFLSATFFSSLVLFVSCISASISTLQNQCWHELPPFISITLQSSKDATSELITRPANITKEKESLNLHFPWSYAPICTHHLPGLRSKLCVYTNTSFSNGRGISIFTTPAIAAEFTNIPAFQDPDALSSKGININSGVWMAQELPGKGIGLLAKSLLNFGDRVTAYTPALLAYLEGELGTLEREKYFRIAIDQLPAATREAFLELCLVYGDKRIRVQDIVKANTFQMMVGGQDHLAVFPETSRLNHACAANAQYYLDPERLTHFVHATRPIAQGEEILISYTSPLEFTEVRQQHLQEGFHFTCTCPRCTAKETSDARLTQILNMQASLNDWSPASLGSPALADQLLALYRQEGLEGFLDIPYGFAALAYSAVGSDKRAVEYAEKAKEAILMKDGSWSTNLRIWEELLENVKRHWSYKRRM